MRYLTLLKNKYDYCSIYNIIERSMVRLGREQSCLFNTEPYVSEEELDSRLNIRDNDFDFEGWFELRNEIEKEAISLRSDERILESYLVRYLCPFDHASSVLFPGEKVSDYDKQTAFILRSIAQYCGKEWFFDNKKAKEIVLAQLQSLPSFPYKAPVPADKEEELDQLIQRHVNDLALLQRLLEAMDRVGHIIQGVLYELNSPLTLDLIQKHSGIRLMDMISAQQMCFVMQWPREYCQTLMGGKLSVDLWDLDSTPGGKKTRKRKQAEISIYLKDKLFLLGQALKDDYTKRQPGGTWLFKGPANLFAYMGLRIAEKCAFESIPWQSITPIIETRADGNYLKGRASHYKTKKQYPQGYVVIDDAIAQVFK